MPAPYPLQWARSVVEVLKQKYARALIFFENVTGIDEIMLAKLLADGRVEYQICKGIIKNLDKWIERWPEQLNDYVVVCDILLNNSVKMPSKLRHYLTTKIEKLNLKSGHSDEGGGAERSEANPPSLTPGGQLWLFPEINPTETHSPPYESGQTATIE